jgi:hypothetical protein
MQRGCFVYEYEYEYEYEQEQEQEQEQEHEQEHEHEHDTGRESQSYWPLFLLNRHSVQRDHLCGFFGNFNCWD